MENFARIFFAQTGFERELFLLSSSEFITATRVVQTIIARQRDEEKPQAARTLAGCGNEVRESWLRKNFAAPERGMRERACVPHVERKNIKHEFAM